MNSAMSSSSPSCSSSSRREGCGVGRARGGVLRRRRVRTGVSRRSGEVGRAAVARDGAAPPTFAQPGEADGDGGDTGHRKDLHVVLVHPQIPPNTGTIARSCAASRVGLHLVKPMGFALDDTKLKRAGLDYWSSVHACTHESWEDFLAYFDSLEPDGGAEKRMLAYSKRGTCLYSAPDTRFRADQVSFLLFGSETEGLSDAQMDAVCERCGEDSLKRIPICEAHVRSLNLSVAAGIALWEGIRQLDYDSDAPAPAGGGAERQRHIDMYDRRVVAGASGRS